MRFLFIIQGEGRGHMTQAIALYDMLRHSEQEVCQVIIGTSRRREVPCYVVEKFKCSVKLIESPNFVTDHAKKSIRLGQTIWKNTLKLPVFLNSLQTLDRIVCDSQPDVIINFYDFLAGIYNGLYNPRMRFVSIGHQYLAAHPSFPWASGSRLKRLLFQAANRITSWGADQRIALSFRELPSIHVPIDLKIWPPLLRKQVLEACPLPGDYLLVYIVNPGYLTDIYHMAKQFPELSIEVFLDLSETATHKVPSSNIRLHALDDQKFITYMSGCRGLVCTAGFESISEALFLGKPVMVVPVSGQYEQACNALDTKLSGAGTYANTFDIIPFIEYLACNQQTSSEEFKDWYAKQPSLFHHWLSTLSLKKPNRKKGA
ncbi:glycosyltransferase family protein [Lunatimonas salinarum]|uniref:glycosyltransferase family protein n=1 Tax=Lunatimonas salinarum TaxID=1774590 RepID=UPI001ADEEB8A|nr:glycosyltransferase family protein [Lunatimonas salinarum]